MDLNQNVPQIFKTANQTIQAESTIVIPVFSEKQSKDFLKYVSDAGVPNDNIGYENPDGSEVFAIYIKSKHLQIIKDACRIYDLTFEVTERIDFEKAQKEGSINYFEHKRQNLMEANPKVLHEYDQLNRILEKKRNLKIKNELSIKFIAEQEINYLFAEPPITTNLLSIVHQSNIKSFIRQGIVGQIVGAGGIGKTHFLTQLALSVAAGTHFLNEYSPGNGGHVFMALGENSDDDIHRLVKKISIKSEFKSFVNKIASRLAMISLCGKEASFVDKNNNPSEFYNHLLKELKLKEPVDGWKLIVIDPISRVLGAQAETDNAAATAFISLLERFTLELKGNPTVLFGHHMSKAGISNIANTDQTSARGSSALTDGVRWQANLERVEDRGDDGKLKDGYKRNQIRMRIVKSNHTELYDPIILSNEDNGCLTLLGIESICNQSTSNQHPNDSKKISNQKSSGKKTSDQEINDIMESAEEDHPQYMQAALYPKHSKRQ